MNSKHLLSIFAAGALLFASCSEEKEVDRTTIPEGGGDDTGRQEVLLSLKNGLVLKKAGTKADETIATDEENYIHSLDVYVFGSKTENGTYTFQELHYYRDDASDVTLPGVNSFSFNLNNDADNSAVTTGLLKLNKGLYVKLYCVANRSDMYQTGVDGTTVTKYADFKSLTQSKPGQADNLVNDGIPKEEDFKKLHVKLIDQTAALNPTIDDVLASPLPMSGAYTTPLDLTDFGSSARTQVSFKLSRMVARFDVINDAAASKFTLEKISMGKGQQGARFFPIETLHTKEADLITYPERLVSADTQQKYDKTAHTTDTTKGAFYSYPSPMNDKAYLILKGKYAVNQTENKEVSYQIPFQQMVNGIGTFIEVAYNHRYTIRITKADTYHLDVDLKVAEWDEKNPVDEYAPDNEFDKTAKIVLTTDATTAGSYVLTDGDDEGKISVLPADGSLFTFKLGSNTKLDYSLIYKSDASPKWLVENAAPVTTPTKASSLETTYSFKVDKDVVDGAVNNIAGAKKLEEITLRLINPASGMRKEIKIMPTPGPVLSFPTQAANNHNRFDPKTMIAYIYNVAAQEIKLDIASETRLTDLNDPASTATGTTATVAAADTWLTPAPASLTTESGSYTLTTDGTGTTNGNTTVDFASTASNAVSQIKVILKDPAIKTLTAASFKTKRPLDNTIDLTTADKPTISLVGVKDNEFKLTVESPEGVEVKGTDASNLWLTLAPSETGASGKKTMVITGKITDETSMLTTPKADGAFTITNKLDATKKIEVKVVTTVPVKPVIGMKTIAGNLSTYTAGTATLYNATSQSVTLTTDVDTKLTAADADWLNLTENVTAKEHVISIQTAQILPLTTAPVLTFTTADGATETVTIALSSPAITAPTALEAGGSGTNTFTAAADPANAKVVMEEATVASQFILKVTSPAGIALGTNTSDWLNVVVSKATGTAGSMSNTVTVGIKPSAAGKLATAITDGKLELTNIISSGGDLTIDIQTTVPTPVP